MTQAATAPGPAERDANKLLKTIFTVAWMAILLGLLVQIGVFSAKISAGAKLPAVQLLVDVASGIAWSVIVCGGVAIGTVAAKSVPQLMGLLGLICAPVAFAAAKGTQRGVAWIAGQPMDQINMLTYQIGAAKTLEYAALGFVLGTVIRTPKSTLTNHTLIGLGFGLVFASLIVWLNMQSMANGAPLPPPRLWATVVNEFIFPLGCSLVIFAVAKLSDHASARERIVAGS